MRAGNHDGWFPTCLDGIVQSLDLIIEKNLKIIVNGGGLNPGGLAQKIQQLVGHYHISNCKPRVDDFLGDCQKLYSESGLHFGRRFVYHGEGRRPQNRNTPAAS